MSHLVTGIALASASHIATQALLCAEDLPTLPVTYEHTDSTNKPLHKPRVVWTDELHQRFLCAIEAAGSDEAAVPTVILRVRLFGTV